MNNSIFAFALVACSLIGVPLGWAIARALSDPEHLKRSVVKTVCYDDGCSLLIEEANKSRTWRWVSIPDDRVRPLAEEQAE